MRLILTALLILTGLLLLPMSVAAYNDEQINTLGYFPVNSGNEQEGTPGSFPFYFDTNNCGNLAITVPGSAFGGQAGNTFTGYLAPVSGAGAVSQGNVNVENWGPNEDGTYTLNINPCQYSCPVPGEIWVEYQLYEQQTDSEGNTIYVPVGMPFRFYLTNIPPES